MPAASLMLTVLSHSFLLFNSTNSTNSHHHSYFEMVEEIATATTATSLLPFEALAGFVTIFFQGLLSDQN